MAQGLYLGKRFDPKRGALGDRIELDPADLLTGRKSEKWLALGSAVLQNIGLFTGRKRTISGAGTVLTKSRLEDTAELEQEMAAHAEIDPGRFAERELVPARTGVKLLRYDLLWVY